MRAAARSAGALLLGILAAGLLPANGPKAELWAGFYTSTTEKRPTSSMAPGSKSSDKVCLSAILDAQKRHGIPNNLLLAIGLQEAGRLANNELTVWPWTVNAEGEGRFFASREHMLEWVEDKRAQGVTSIDVGCMQINLKWHKGAFSSLEDAATPRANVDYAARFLLSLYRDTGNWWQAAGRYHSATPQFKQRYLAKLESNLAAATRLFDAQANVPMQVRSGPAAADETPAPPVFWGGGNLEDSSGTMSFSIYSKHALQPVLPGYKKWF